MRYPKSALLTLCIAVHMRSLCFSRCSLAALDQSGESRRRSARHFFRDGPWLGLPDHFEAERRIAVKSMQIGQGAGPGSD